MINKDIDKGLIEKTENFDILLIISREMII